MRRIPPAPIDDVLRDLRATLSVSPRAVLSAPPGAGKTTRIPQSLLSESWLEGRKILMLEPRRLAARNAAEFIASTMEETAGQTVGYVIRGETRVSKQTRIEVVTEGVLTRMLVQEQDLPGVGMVIFDEFHERSIHADMGLALTLDLQKHLRPELRVLVMSATLDVEQVRKLLGHAPVVTSAGRAYPVDTHFASADDDRPIDVRLAAAIMRAYRLHEGDLLAFLPGVREIRRTEERLLDGGLPEDAVIHQLFGDASYEQQRTALVPDPSGRRKIILATSIAETSLTIEGVRIVIDSGLARTVQFDPRRAMTGLITVPVSQAIAEQRRGRAGRLGPGVCYRLWTEARHSSLPAFPTPEIKATDLTHVALDLAAWGDPYGESLAFIDPPPRASIERVRSLLTDLDVLDESGLLTHHGKRLAALPVHPRYAHMIIRANERGHGSLACDVAALLEERDLFAGRKDEDIDLSARVVELHRSPRRNVRSRDSVERIREQSRRFMKLAAIKPSEADPEATGLVLGLAYPDRVARRRGSTGDYQLSSGGTARLPARSVLDKHEFLAIGLVDSGASGARIHLAAPLTAAEVEIILAGRIGTSREIRWDNSSTSVIAREVRTAGGIILDERAIRGDDPGIPDALLEGVRSLGLHVLPWHKESLSFVARSEWIRRNNLGSSDWPDCSQDSLAATLETWLRPFMDGMKRLEHLSRLKMTAVLSARFSHDQLRLLDKLAPTHLQVPSGSRIHIDYESADTPVLAVKLQELFGLTETPTVGGGATPVTIHLLSPAGRPLAVTQDLPSFWKNTYPEIRKQMRARYPKHPWPEDPMTATPTRRTNQRK